MEFLAAAFEVEPNLTVWLQFLFKQMKVPEMVSLKCTFAIGDL